MRVIRSVAAVALAECRPSARLSMGAVFGVASSTGTRSAPSVRPPQLMSVHRGSELKEWNKEDEDEDAGERRGANKLESGRRQSEWTTLPNGGRLRVREGCLSIDPSGWGGGPRAYTL